MFLLVLQNCKDATHLERHVCSDGVGPLLGSYGKHGKTKSCMFLQGFGLFMGKIWLNNRLKSSRELFGILKAKTSKFHDFWIVGPLEPLMY